MLMMLRASARDMMLSLEHDIIHTGYAIITHMRC